MHAFTVRRVTSSAPARLISGVAFPPTWWTPATTSNATDGPATDVVHTTEPLWCSRLIRQVTGAALPDYQPTGSPLAYQNAPTTLNLLFLSLPLHHRRRHVKLSRDLFDTIGRNSGPTGLSANIDGGSQQLGRKFSACLLITSTGSRNQMRR